MNKIFANILDFSRKVNRQHIQMAWALLVLVLLVLGAGAPEDGGPGIGPIGK